MKKTSTCFLILIVIFFQLHIAHCYSQTWSKVPGKYRDTWKSEMIVYNNKLYVVMATYDSINGMGIHGIARFDGTKWDTVGPGLDGVSLVLGKYNNELYAGGHILIYNQSPSGRIVRWNDSNWQAAGTIIEDRLYCMEVYKGELYVGGQFSNMDGKTVSNIARWNGSTWNDVGGGVGGGFSEVDAMAVYNGELYVGGAFGTAGGSLPVNNFARWNGTKWDSVAGGFVGGGPGAMLTDTVKNLLYAAGGLWQSGNKQFYGIAQWDGNTWESIGNDTIPGGLALCLYHGFLYSGGGGVTTYNGTTLNGIARWDGTTWQPVGSGAYGVLAMTVYNDDLYVGGAFPDIGGDTSMRYIARWHTPVGIEKFEVQSSKCKVYPNPTKNEITIELTEQLQQATKLNLCLYDNLGKEVLCEAIANSQKQTINTSCLSKGFYLARLFDEKHNSLAVQKIVVE